MQILKTIFQKTPGMSRLQRLSRLYRSLIIAGLIVLIITAMAVIKVTPYAVYANKEYGFRIKYPNYWRVIEKPQGVDAVIFVTPQENEADQYRENVNVTIKNLPANVRSVKELTSTITRQLVGLFEGNIEVLQSRSMRIAGRPGHVLIFSGRDAQEPVEYMHAWFVSGRTIYIITYTALQKDFDKNFKKALTMIRSIRLI